MDIPIILAGGLNPENVEQAIRQVRPAGADPLGQGLRAGCQFRMGAGRSQKGTV